MKNPFIETGYYGGRTLTQLSFWLIVAVLVAGVIAGCVGAWHLWPNKSCDPPNHLVYAYTKQVLEGKILVTKNFYYCES